MATFTDRVKVILDVAGETASSGLAKFRTDIQNADTAAGKLKAGTGAAFSFAAQHATALAVTGGGALAAFAAKGVGMFTGLALEAGRFSDATRLSTQDASRWLEVAGDLGIEGAKIQGAIAKMSKEFDTNAGTLKKWGIEAVRTRDGQLDVNETFLAAIDRLKEIPDPAERASAAQQLFGRSWTDLAELINKGAPALRDSLADVSDAKVIDPEEVAKAREFRDTMDKLADVGEDLAISLGEVLVPTLIVVAKTATAVATGIEAVSSAGSKLGHVIQLQSSLNDQINAYLETAAKWTGSAEDLKKALEDQGASTELAADIAQQFADGAADAGDSTDDLTDALEDNTQAAHKAYDAQGRLNDQIAAAEAKVRDLLQAEKDEADARRAATDATFAIHAADKAYREQLLATVQTLNDAAASEDQKTAAQDEAIQKAAALADAEVRRAEEQAKANGYTLSEIDAQRLWTQSMQGSAGYIVGDLHNAILGYIADVNGIPSEKVTTVRVAQGAGGSASNGRVSQFASGTQFSPAGFALLGEQGAELVNLPRGAQVTPASQTRHLLEGAGTTNVTINMPAGSRADDVVRATRLYARRNGSSS